MARILQILQRAYPKATCSLRFRNPLELLVATILSAQCTDTLVNDVTADLFVKYKTAQAYAHAKPLALEQDVSRVNFYRNKAKSIRLACTTIVERFEGKVPDRMEDLLSLHGVARKTANVVLGNGFGVQAGVVVDTHVMRLSQRLGLTRQTDRDKIEGDLMRITPRRHWTRLAHRFIEHGRRVCKARQPLCRQCAIGKSLCPSYTP